MTDNGSVMISEEFTAGLHNLGIVHERTLPLSAYQNGKQGNLWATLKGRLMAMIESSEQLTLDRLCLLTQVWLEYDYHRNLHSEIGTTPLTRFIEAPSVRRQRRSDGTCTLDGKRFEIPSRFGHMESITLSYARWDLANVELIDPDTGVVLSRVYPLDKNVNAQTSRRAREARHTPTEPALADRDPADVLVLAVD